MALRIYQHAASFRGQSSPTTWVYRITVNTCLDFLRAEKRRSRVVHPTDYSRPVKAFLAEAERRYRFMRPVDLAYSIPLLLVLALTGGRLVLDLLVPRYVEADNAAVVAWAYGIFFLAVCGLGYYFTYRNWRKENGTIWAEIRRMRQEME